MRLAHTHPQLAATGAHQTSLPGERLTLILFDIIEIERARARAHALERPRKLDAQESQRRAHATDMRRNVPPSSLHGRRRCSQATTTTMCQRTVSSSR